MKLNEADHSSRLLPRLRMSECIPPLSVTSYNPVMEILIFALESVKKLLKVAAV
jgi:hypothetical protein